MTFTLTKTFTVDEAEQNNSILVKYNYNTIWWTSRGKKRRNEKIINDSISYLMTRMIMVSIDFVYENVRIRVNSAFAVSNNEMFLERIVFEFQSKHRRQNTNFYINNNTLLSLSTGDAHNVTRCSSFSTEEKKTRKTSPRTNGICAIRF